MISLTFCQYRLEQVVQLHELLTETLLLIADRKNCALGLVASIVEQFQNQNIASNFS